MEDFVNKFGWQKIAIVMGILGIFMLVFVVLSFLGMNKKASNQNQSGSSNQLSNSNQADKNPTAPTTTGAPDTFRSNPNLPGGQQVLSEKFTNGAMQISYPNGFTPTESAINGGGEAVSFTNGANQTIEIDTYDTATTPLTQLVNALRALGYKEERVDNGDGITYKFAGSVGGGPNMIREKAILFSQNNKTYRILLTYRSATTDSDLEDAFDSMVGSLQLL
ncbi:MAG TPA: hypothetical protein VHE53_01970 [Patescibacteria group bacterium]|nr:hypothetical protein [Patescibacteria group bacterium]